MKRAAGGRVRKRRAPRANVLAGMRARAGLHYFVIHALQASPNRRRRDGRREGAYVCCWIDFAIEDGALELAKFYIRKARYRPRSVKERMWVEPRECPAGSAKYFREAKDDGASLVFQRYPAGS